MNYKNAAEILPTHLLEEVQKYSEGMVIYVPKSSGRAGWGNHTGLRKELDARNARIRKSFGESSSISELAELYRLSEAAIKKIVYAKK
ncbi:CD3324 family protein [Fusibacter tunisiensis]|uniref:Mor family transcriptional regulator n=1 Tax=Fusibacter tunisiensis TaxID=1008308 RepID=A0ABS2MPV1_9FIRM|nr:CD3324 family protein [Fusibacter tunisiensis]MBM7561433.1 Mor family transcriptional regulator [Fusibacter tunisiensis]